VLLDINLIWFGYIAISCGEQGFFTPSNDFYLPSLRLEGGSASWGCCSVIIRKVHFCNYIVLNVKSKVEVSLLISKIQERTSSNGTDEFNCSHKLIYKIIFLKYKKGHCQETFKMLSFYRFIFY
jgi:hypothetical protein